MGLSVWRGGDEQVKGDVTTGDVRKVGGKAGPCRA